MECFYIFTGPELLHEKGFSYSMYVDGDVYCHNDPLSFPLNSVKDFAGAITKRSIKEILNLNETNDAEVAVKLYGNSEALEEGRIQTGIMYFNNTSLAKKGFLNKISQVYQEAIDNDIPRKGDDSLLALFRVAYPDWGYMDLGRQYNMITFKRGAGEDWLRTDEQMINNAVFVHFTNHVKPWTNTWFFPTYTYEYFYHMWRRHAIDALSDEELETHFPDIHATLSDEHLRFYWYPTKNVGDLITPYFLKKVCKVPDLGQYTISEETITQLEHQLTTKAIVTRVIRIAKRLLKQRQAPPRYARYSVSTGSVIRLCGNHAMVFGSGIRSQDQEVHRSFVRAVRGPLTRKRFIDSSFPCPPVYGDPGLLLPKYYQPKKKTPKFGVGIIPHFTEYKTVSEQYKNDKDVCVIDMGCGDLEKVIDQIASCHKTLSSSLHGLILSHAYGVPTRQVQYSENIKGDGTKFLDYYSSIPIKRIPPVMAAGFSYIPVSELVEFKYEQPQPIDTSRLEDAMFFDADGFRKSAYYPYG